MLQCLVIDVGRRPVIIPVKRSAGLPKSGAALSRSLAALTLLFIFSGPVVVLCLFSASLNAQVCDGADCAGPSSAQPDQGGTSNATDQEVQLPPITVTAPPILREETLVGPNQQPEWTTRRRFSQTRIYVLPPWQLAAYTTWRIQKLRTDEEEDEESKGDVNVGNLLAQEIELGLPYRFQVEYQAEGSNDTGEWEFRDQSIEVRWALADWDRIPLNPTVFGEWKFRNAEADSFETKLLLGGDIVPRWHGGMNIFFEQQVGDQREQEIAGTGALSYTLLDELLSVGIEMEFTAEREAAPP